MGPVGLTCRPRHAAFQESPPDAALRLPDIRTNSSRTDTMLISADAKLVQVERDHLGRDDHMFMYSHYKVAHNKKQQHTSPKTKSPRTATPRGQEHIGTKSTTSKSYTHHHDQQSPRRAMVSCDRLASLMKTKDSLDAIARGSRKRTTAAASAPQQTGAEKRDDVGRSGGVHIGGTPTVSSNTTNPSATATAMVDNDDSNLKVTLSTFYASGVAYGDDSGGGCGDGFDGSGGGSGFDEVPKELCGLVKSMPTKRALDAYNQSSSIVSLLWEQFDAKLLALPHSSLLSSSTSRPLITAQVPAARVPLAPSNLGSVNPNTNTNYNYNNNDTKQPIDLTSGDVGSGGGGEEGEEPSASFSLMQEDDETATTPTATTTTAHPVGATTTDMPVFNPSMAIVSSPSRVEEDLVDWLVLESVLEKAGVVENYTFSEAAYDGGGAADSSSPILNSSSVDQVKTFHYEGPPIRGVLASRRIQLLQRLWSSTRDSALVGI